MIDTKCGQNGEHFICGVVLRTDFHPAYACVGRGKRGQASKRGKFE